LSYVVKQLQLDIPIGTSENGVAEKIKDFIEKQKSLDVYEDIIESKKENKVFSITQCEVTMEKHNYSPIIPILRDPEQFMVLVPTNKALEVVDKIKTEYEIQFSKVRNRLPLHMNMVFSIVNNLYMPLWMRPVVCLLEKVIIMHFGKLRQLMK